VTARKGSFTIKAYPGDSRSSSSRSAKTAAQTRKGVATKKAVHPQKSGSGRAKPLVDAQPQSQSQAATEAGMFLHTDDAWSNAYFEVKDLHCKERVLFG
jgi:hypothetical protein